ncbi:YaaR family protein [Proteiniborus sp. MB09-C3]|uniref:YaaR family protein n=1 Tax=Proteiniborus sp. MB09-C3 TaxID=3050072 RepID=UPI002556A558|nr:YaaR family protein [Proteiniborus sp. MB09-C3]WIV12317.1 YaaR family protein [Proteiniborus sp. MB09-C3]
MKINDVMNKTTQAIDLPSTQDVKKKDLQRSKFTEELNRVDELTVKERLEKLLERIDKQADRLSKNITIKEVLAYKTLISEFLKESVDSMVKFKKDSFLDGRGRHRVYGIIKKVDEELEGLTKDVLSKEKDNIRILKRLDDIRGLILDIYM